MSTTSPSLFLAPPEGHPAWVTCPSTTVALPSSLVSVTTTFCPSTSETLTILALISTRSPGLASLSPLPVSLSRAQRLRCSKLSGGGSISTVMEAVTDGDNSNPLPSVNAARNMCEPRLNPVIRVVDPDATAVPPAAPDVGNAESIRHAHVVPSGASAISTLIATDVVPAAKVDPERGPVMDRDGAGSTCTNPSRIRVVLPRGPVAVRVTLY